MPDEVEAEATEEPAVTEAETPGAAAEVAEDPTPEPPTTWRSFRSGSASTLRWICRLVALLLALDAVLVALLHDVSPGNPVVAGLFKIGDALAGPFGRDNGLFSFGGQHPETKNAFVNWGLAAVLYLLAGRLLHRLIAPRAKGFTSDEPVTRSTI